MPRTRSAQPDLPPITRQVVLDAAVALVRRHGVEALTVRRLAAELDVWPTTIYHHVGGTKDGLLTLTLDAVAGDVVLPEPGDGPWPEVVTDIAWRIRASVAAYPGVASYLLTAPAPGPNAQRIMERLLRVLVERAGLPLPVAFDAFLALTGYVLHHVQREEAGTTASRIERYAELGARDGLPLTAEVARTLPTDADERFRGGLRVVLAGISTLATESPAAGG